MDQFLFSSDGAANDHQLPQSLSREWLAPRGVRTIEAMGVGFSGAQVYRCSASESAWALKRWSAGTPVERVALVHEMIREAKRAGCEYLPHLEVTRGGSTFVCDPSGYVWELATWMPGRPLSKHANSESIARGSEAIAKFHAAVRPLSHVPTKTGSSRLTAFGPTRRVSDAVLSRLRRLEELRDTLPMALEAVRCGMTGVSPEVASVLEKVAKRLAGCWLEALDRAHVRLNWWIDRPVEVQYVLRDVHREHILFSPSKTSKGATDEPLPRLVNAVDGHSPQDGTGPPAADSVSHSRAVSGMIDFDAVRIDSVACDLSRWTLSFCGQGEVGRDALHHVLAGYEAVWRLSEEEISLCETLNETSPWIALANWVVWLGLKEKTFANEAITVVSRINELAELIFQDWGTVSENR